MNLVPQNINEAIKHLSGRSEEEIFKDASDREIYDLWNDGLTDFNSSILCIKELKNRGATGFLNLIKVSPWYNADINVWPEMTHEKKEKLNKVMNEGIKHLSGRSSDEIRKHIATIIKPLYQKLPQIFKKYGFKNYDISLEDDDTCIHIEKHGEIKFRIYYHPHLLLYYLE